MLIRDRLASLAGKLEDAASEMRAAEHEIRFAAGMEWPGDDPTAAVEWRPRSETPPRGPVWASNGEVVWLIRCDGTPIHEGATSVHWWTTALIPAPPRGTAPAEHPNRSF